VGEVDRLNGVIEDFLSYARPREPRRKDTSLNELVEDVLKLQRTALPPGVEMRAELDPTLPVVHVDPELLKQSLINVLKNAVDAVAPQGTIIVRTRGMDGALRTYEVVEVEDTGPGVPAGDLERIFQPFYTTKTRGTGLGLAIAARVLEAHDGQIAAENVSPHGAKFSFHIPRRRL
jgi:signal transduction histidine kinase